MKKYLVMLAAAIMAFAACEKKEGPQGEDPGKDPVTNASELYLTYDLDFQLGVHTGYAGVTATIEGDKILEFFDMTEEEFFIAMGKFDFDGKAFVDNTLDFGSCYQEYGEWVYEWKAPTSSNVGFWMTDKGVVCEWADGTFFTESQCWYFRTDVEMDEEFSYDLMWDFTVGFHEGNYTPNAKVGDKFSFTHFIFEEETGKTVYLTFNLNVIDYVPRTYTVLDTQTSEMTVEYNNAYLPIAVTGFDYASAASKLGVTDPFKECDIYPLAADGTFSKVPSVDNWFGADGNVSGWGDNAIFDFKYDTGVAEDNFTLFCMPFNPNKVETDEEGNEVPAPQTAADKCGTFTASVAFVNGSDQAVVLKLVLTIEEPKAWDGEIVKTYDLSYEFAHNNEWYGATIELNADEITTAIGVSPTEAKMLGADKFAATDLYYANEAGVDLLNVYFYDGEFVAAPIALAEGEDVAARCGTATGTFYLVNGDKGVQVNVTATITVPAAE